MLESVASNKVNNIGSHFVNNCKLGPWLETENLKPICSNSNRLYRKRYYTSTFEKEQFSNHNSDGILKRRKEYINKQSGLVLNKNKNLLKLKINCYRKHSNFYRMARTSCQIRQDNDSSYNEQLECFYPRNRSLSQLNVGLCLPHHHLAGIDSSSDLLQNPIVNRRHLNANSQHHQISTHTPHPIIHNKDSLTTPTHSNNYFNVPLSQVTQSFQSCGLPTTRTNSTVLRQHQQSRRRLHYPGDLDPLYQPITYASTQYPQPRPLNIINSRPPVSASIIPNMTLPTILSSFPLITCSFSPNQNRHRFSAYPINPYLSQQHQQQHQLHQTLFSHTPLSATTIISHSSAFCSNVIQGDISSTQCYQCAIIAGSTALRTLPNLSSLMQFSGGTATANLITLAAVPTDGRLSYVPVHAIHNWPNHNPYLPAALSFNDLSTILPNSISRHILQDHLTQRLLSTSSDVGIQFVMMAQSPLLGSNDVSQIRHHLIPMSRTDQLSPIAVSRYLPIIDHMPLIDQPKPPGITKHELDQIPIKKFTKLNINSVTIDNDKDRCMICLDDFKTAEIIRMLTCSHDFHSSCVERWLKINRTCPLCRADATGHCPRKSS